MNISEIHDFIDLITSQERGGFNTPAEKDAALDRASITLFEFYRPKYAKDIVAKEALSPFRVLYPFVTDGQGRITLTSGQNFVSLLAMEVEVYDPDTASSYNPIRTYDVEFPNEDELAERKNSHINPPKTIAPIADTLGVGWYNLWPQQVHSGNMYFLKRPAKPVFGYTQSGRVITYVSATSTQLEWTEPYLNTVIFLALRYLFINLDNEVLVEQMTKFLSEK